MFSSKKRVLHTYSNAVDVIIVQEKNQNAQCVVFEHGRIASRVPPWDTLYRIRTKCMHKYAAKRNDDGCDDDNNGSILYITAI